MNDIEDLIERLTKRFPDLVISIDEPESVESPDASWWLDLTLEDYNAVIEWRPARGFGVSARETEVYGEGADEIYPDVNSAFERLTDMLFGREASSPPAETILKKLRKSRDLSQTDLAKRMHVNQAAISKMERRSDMYISTLRNVIAAMGGVLEIRARFPEGVFQIVQFEDLD